jgi:tetratricopeptide (TPR) repeat protein
MFGFIARVYITSFNYRIEPDEEFNQYIKVLTQWGEALTTLNPRRFILISFYFVRRMLRYNISRSVPGLSLFVECAAFFMWSGFSLRISKKILDSAYMAGIEDHPSSFIDYRFILKMHDFHAGVLEEDKDFEKVISTGMRVGDFWPTTIYSVYSGYVSIECGSFQRFAKAVEKMKEISESFDNSHAQAQVYRLSAVGHFRFRMLDLTSDLVEEGIKYTGKTGHLTPLLVLWCIKSQLHSLHNEPAEAREALDEATRLVQDKKIITNYHIHYLQAKAGIEYLDLKKAVHSQEKPSGQVKVLLKTIGKLLSLSAKMKVTYVDTYRLKAQVYWLLKRQNLAGKNFILSVQSGRRYNCTLELARTYFEAGKFLQSKECSKRTLIGINGREYLLKAKSMFEEMDLKWDLEEYERYMEG